MNVPPGDTDHGFPFLFGGAFIEAIAPDSPVYLSVEFPFLFGGAFIEASAGVAWAKNATGGFPFLFGGAFIEAQIKRVSLRNLSQFPFLFGGAFIEALLTTHYLLRAKYFPSFSEGLSLRRQYLDAVSC